MAKYFKTAITLCFVLLTGCQEGGEAGDLFGQWRMTDTQYVSFAGSIVRLRDTTAGEVFGNFQRSADSLFIQCYSIYEEKADTVMVEDNIGFKPFNNIRVRIKTVDDDRLVLSKDGRLWSFVKY